MRKRSDVKITSFFMDQVIKMALFKADNPIIYYYVYGNKTYEEEIEFYLREHIQTVIPLNLSSSTGCGFKIMTYDTAEIRNLDIFLEQYEGWIQTTRRNEFNDLETNVIDLDKALAGTNNRITGNLLNGNDVNWINFKLNAHKSLTAFRMINLLGSATTGNYVLSFGDDKISASVPVNASVNNTTVYRKNLNGDTFNLALTNCSISGYICEYKGLEEYNFTCDHDITGMDGDFDTVSSEFNIGEDDSWWTKFDLNIGRPINMKSLNIAFELLNIVDPPQVIDVWIDSYLNGVHQGYVHDGGETADHYNATNPKTIYYANYFKNYTVDRIVIAFKTPIRFIYENKLKIYNIFVGY